MLDRLATKGLRPRWRCRDERQLRHHAHMSREMVEHAQDAEQGIGALLQEFAFAQGTQGQVRRRTCAQFDCGDDLTLPQREGIMRLRQLPDDSLGIACLHLVSKMPLGHS